MAESPLILVANNDKPEKSGRVRRAPKVSAYCPVCKSSTWIMANQGPADLLNHKVLKIRCCVHCMAKGRVTTW